MHCFGKKTAEDVESSKKNKEIDGGLKADRKASANKYKVLLLGTGDAGKSTFCKQMQIMHGHSFTPAELQRYGDVLKENCIISLQNLIVACDVSSLCFKADLQKWGYDFTEDLKPSIRKLLSCKELTPEIADIISELWHTGPIMSALQRANEIQLFGGDAGVKYFVDNCRRFTMQDFKPSSNDIVRAKMRTECIIEVNFKTSQGQEFTVVDVGGQRGERSKWLHCFDDVTAVLYLVAANEYDMVLEEDTKTNRMEESLQLFKKLSGSSHFDNTSFILFLNKSDLLKIKTKSLRHFYRDFTEFEENLKATKLQSVASEEIDCIVSFEYLKAQFEEAYQGKRALYSFLTCAIDRKNCKRVWTSVKDSIMNTTLRDSGL